MFYAALALLLNLQTNLTNDKFMKCNQTIM